MLYAIFLGLYPQFFEEVNELSYLGLMFPRQKKL